MRPGGIFSDALLVAVEAVAGQQAQNWMFDYVSDNSLALKLVL